MPILLITSDDVDVYLAAQKYGCKAVIARGQELQDDGELSWQIGDQVLTNRPEWQDQTPKDLGTHAVISGGEVLELGPHKNNNDDLPF